MPNDYVIYKYGERRHLEDLIKLGRISFGIADFYKDSSLTSAQQDNEIQRNFNPSAEQHQLLTGSDFKPIKQPCDESDGIQR